MGNGAGWRRPSNVSSCSSWSPASSSSSRRFWSSPTGSGIGRRCGHDVPVFRRRAKDWRTTTHPAGRSATRSCSCSSSPPSEASARAGRWCRGAGVVAGLSLFWQTDIGLYTLAAGFAFYLGDSSFPRRLGMAAGRLPCSRPGCSSRLCFLFGQRVLSITFAERLLEPLLLYADRVRQRAHELEAGLGLLVQPDRLPVWRSHRSR